MKTAPALRPPAYIGYSALCIASLALLACSRPAPAPSPAASGAPGPAVAAPPSATPAAAPSIKRLELDTAADAFRHVLRLGPKVLAIGETHAPADVTGVESSTKRFARDLLPVAAPSAKTLVLELWVADPKCNRAQVAQVQKGTQEVTQNQAKTNPSEFMVLGSEAKRLGVMPKILVPSCDEYAGILDAGGRDIETMLRMIARLSEAEIKKGLAAHPDAMVLAYGGAMHNDVSPAKGREDFSFGPSLAAATGDRYVELDLIVPEFVRDTEAWRALPWYAAFDAKAHGKKAVLFETGPRSFVLVFPKSS